MKQGELFKVELMREQALCCVIEKNGMNFDITVTCDVTVCGRVDDLSAFTRCFGTDENVQPSAVEGKMKEEIRSVLSIVFAKIKMNGVTYEQLRNSGNDIEDEIRNQLSDSWRSIYGIETCVIGVKEIKASDEDVAKLNSFMQPVKSTMMADSLLAGVMGSVGMAGNPVNANVMGSVGVVSSTSNSWTCACGGVSEGKFCPQCGSKRSSRPEDGWVCPKCGTANNGKFCFECGERYQC